MPITDWPNPTFYWQLLDVRQYAGHLNAVCNDMDPSGLDSDMMLLRATLRNVTTSVNRLSENYERNPPSA